MSDECEVCGSLMHDLWGHIHCCKCDPPGCAYPRIGMERDEK